jgi:pimeloyl-ACP methyl ester carboxylesterase
MRYQVKLVCLFILVTLVGGAGEGVAQEIPQGTWNGYLYPPDISTPLPFEWEVEGAGASVEITMNNRLGTRTLQAVRADGSEIYFQWMLDFSMECLVERVDDGTFQGACRDPKDGRGGMIVAPPGVKLREDAIDMDAALAVWGPVYTEPENLMELPAPVRFDVGGRKMNLLAAGEGEVTVVLESGLGDDLHIWESVQRRMASRTRVVAYDRAGLGDSEAGTDPRTPEQVARELHALLGASGVEPPYVLVGHELGGFFIRSFVALYPDEVAGLVFVESTHEEQAARWHALDAEAWESYWTQQQAFYGQLSAPIRAEFDLYARIMDASILPGAGPLPDVPTVVMTSQKRVQEPRWVGETKEGQAVREQLHKRWVDQVSDGTHMIVKTRSGFLHQEQPDSVVDAIRQVLDAVTGSD